MVYLAAAAFGGALCGLGSVYFVGLVWTVVVLAVFRIGRRALGPGTLLAYGIGYSLPGCFFGYSNANENLASGYTAVGIVYCIVIVLGPLMTVFGLVWAMRRIGTGRPGASQIDP